MKNVMALYDQSVSSLQKLNWLPVLLARISLGSVFILSGWGKLHNLDKVTEFFTELGIPFASLNAGLVGFTELSCGVLILIGLLTRLASIPLIATMVVAIITAKREDIGGITDLLALEEFVYIVIFIWFIVNGAGKVSIDNVLCRKWATK